MTFVTIGTPYEREVERLTRSAGALGLEVRVYRTENRGSWRSNLDAKSETILRAMDEHPGRDIVFVDADAEFRSWPAVFDELSAKREHDLAVCFFRESRLERNELLSGTLWVANSPAGRKIVEAWDRMGKKNHAIRHQKCLDLVLGALKTCRIYRLNRAYTRIYDHPGMRGVAPVIEHFQASRRFRRSIPGRTEAGQGQAQGVPAS